MHIFSTSVYSHYPEVQTRAFCS